MDNNINNRDLIAQMYTEHAEDMKRYLLSYTRDMMKAEDMLHDLFMKVMQIDLITPGTARSLLIMVARRMIIDDARHIAFVRRQTENIKCSMEYMDHPGSTMAEVHDLMQLEEARLQAMAKKRACVYRLYRHEGMTADEIAAELSLSKRTVESHIYLSTREIRAYMREVM